MGHPFTGKHCPLKGTFIRQYPYALITTQESGPQTATDLGRCVYVFTSVISETASHTHTHNRIITHNHTVTHLVSFGPGEALGPGDSDGPPLSLVSLWRRMVQSNTVSYTDSVTLEIVEGIEATEEMMCVCVVLFLCCLLTALPTIPCAPTGPRSPLSPCRRGRRLRRCITHTHIHIHTHSCRC